jgi:hypothetical protein
MASIRHVALDIQPLLSAGDTPASISGKTRLSVSVKCYFAFETIDVGKLFNAQIMLISNDDSTTDKDSVPNDPILLYQFHFPTKFEWNGVEVVANVPLDFIKIPEDLVNVDDPNMGGTVQREYNTTILAEKLNEDPGLHFEWKTQPGLPPKHVGYLKRNKDEIQALVTLNDSQGEPKDMKRSTPPISLAI